MIELKYQLEALDPFYEHEREEDYLFDPFYKKFDSEEEADKWLVKKNAEYRDKFFKYVKVEVKEIV